MPRNIDLTEAEWTLMEQLWGAPGQTGRAGHPGDGAVSAGDGLLRREDR